MLCSHTIELIQIKKGYIFVKKTCDFVLGNEKLPTFAPSKTESIVR